MADNFRQKSNIMMPAQQLQTHSNRSDTFTRVQPKPAQQSQLGELLGVMNESLPEVARGVTNEISIALELDRTKQEKLAARGELPSEDATQAGKDAHKAVDDRNDVLDTVQKVRGIAMNFEGDAEAWDEIMDTELAGLLERTGGNPDQLGTTAMMFNEFIPQIEEQRFKTVQRLDQISKYTTQQKSYMKAVNESTSDEELAKALAVVESDSKAMMILSETNEQAMVDAAIQMAVDQDDDRLIEFIKNNSEESGLYDKTPALSKAQEQMQSRLLAARQGERAREEATFEEDAYLGKYGNSFEAFTKEMEKSEFKHTAPKMHQLWNQAQARLDADFKKKKAVDNMLGITDVKEIVDRGELRLQDGSIDPIAWLNFDKETTAAVIAEYDSRFVSRLSKDLEGLDGAGRSKVIREHRLKRSAFLTENQLVDDQLTNVFKLMEDFPIENTDIEKLPPQLFVALSTLDDMENSPSGLATHASPKAIAMSDFYKKAKANGLTDVQAFAQAKKLAVRKPLELADKKERKRFDKTVSSAVSEAIGGGWFGPDDISDTQMRMLESEVSDYALELGALNHDPERSAKLAANAVLGNMTQLQNGDLVYGKPTWIARQMGLENPNEAMAKLDTLAEKVSLLSAEEGFSHLRINTDTPYDEWIPQISSNGTVRFMDADQNYVTSPILLSSVGGFTIQQKVQHIADREKIITEARLRQSTYRNTVERLKEQQETPPVNPRMRNRQTKF